MEAFSANRLESSPHWPYLAASAVLTTFAAERLRPLGAREPDFARVAAMLVDHAEPVRAGPDSGRWRLRNDVRRQVLATLGSRERIQSALGANVEDRSGDPAQRALAELVTESTPPRLAGRSLEDLLGIDRAIDWLEATHIEPLPSRTDILAQIQREKLLEPLRRLAQGFAGRETELRTLRQYVDSLPSQSVLESFGRLGRRVQAVFGDRPPLVIHGPGGAGKSTLVAKFILDHTDASNPQPLPFVLLDFDRGNLDPTRPDGVMIELATQLRVQFPEHDVRLANLEERVRIRLAGEDEFQYAGSAHFDSSLYARAELASIMNEIAANTRRNLLFVVDTFEIVQRRGSTAVYSLLDFISGLMAEVERLRIVLVGRGGIRREDFALLGEIPDWEELPLRGFDPLAGRAYLRERLQRFALPAVSDADLDQLVLRVRGNPLGLRLAAQVFAREGLSGIDDAIGRQRLNEAIAEEQMQGLLHQRIVEHLDNDELKKIANPGLIVRRITPDVIREVLARPCELDLTDSSADDLFELLRQEVSLVEPIDDNTLRHRPDVRLIMLPALRRDLGSLAWRVDDAAVTYWQTQSGPAARAEEIYHRLWRDDGRSDLDSSWIPEAGPFLEGAWDEFQSTAPGDWARIWLSQKLNRELPEELRQRADQLDWERDVELKARTLLSDGQTAQALRQINERPRERRVAASPLWLLEIDLHLLHGDTGTASRIIAAAMQRLDDTIDGRHTLALLARRTAVEERLGQLDRARQTATEALTFARAMGDSASIFACGVTLCRLARKTGRLNDPEIAALAAELSTLSTNTAVRRTLEDRPSLLREAAAEIGQVAPSLLADALDRLGFETQTAESVVTFEDLPASLTPLLASREHLWRDADAGARWIGVLHFISENLRADRLDPEISRDLAKLYADSAERLLHRTL